jgi:hypothetical protein
VVGKVSRSWGREAELEVCRVDHTWTFPVLRQPVLSLIWDINIHARLHVQAYAFAHASLCIWLRQIFIIPVLLKRKWKEGEGEELVQGHSLAWDSNSV